MKKIRLVFNSILFFSVSFQVSAQWLWQNPIPTGNVLNSVYMSDFNTGWSVGMNGIILKTSDLGVNWIQQNTNTQYNLNDISFIGDNNGIAVGNNATILKTSNGGNDWTPVIIPIAVNLNKIFFSDNQIGWIAADNGIILKSTDNGNSWNMIQLPTQYNLNSISFFNNNIGIVVGGWSTIYKTSDGGNSWIQQVSGVINRSFFDATFINDTTIFIAGDYSILRTTNGGLNWSSQTFNDYLKKVIFINDSTGIALGTWGSVLRTSNVGLNWENQINDSLGSLRGLSFYNETYGIAVGGGYFHTEYEGANVINSTDGGISWFKQSKTVTSILELTKTYFTDINNGYIVGGDPGSASQPGIILKTTNSGETWGNIFNSQPLYDICFKDNNNGIVVGLFGKIHRTMNAGLNWETLNSGITIPLYGVSYNENNIAVAVGGLYQNGYTGKIIKTSNEGDTWSEKLNFTDCYFKDVCYCGSNTFIVVGKNGYIFKSTDNGDTWISQSRATTQNLISVYFYDINNGIAVGEWGTIIKTTNGGSSWELLQSGTNKILYDVSYINPNNATIVGEGGLILKTSDGGLTWDLVPSHTNFDLFGVLSLNSEIGTIVGQLGSILHTTNGGVTFIDDENNITQPEEYLLLQNFPNPFNPSTKISWQAPVDGWQSLKVYDILGREVETLVNEYRAAGKYEVVFDAFNLPSGIYFYRLQEGNFNQTKKMILLK